MRRKKQNTPIAAFQEISNSKKRAFLVACARTGRITAASRLSHMHWRNHYNWLRKDPEYAQACKEAKRMAADFAEEDVLKRAFEGEYKPIIYQGKIRGRYKEERTATNRRSTAYNVFPSELNSGEAANR